MTKREVTRAVRQYEAGRTLREIAAETGVDSATVWYHLRGLVQTRRRGPRGRTDITDAQILELRDEFELSWPQIAAELDMSRTGVRARYLRANGQERWR